jgi:hypothetical protein
MGFVEQDAHQLGDCHCGVRIVQLNRDFLGEGTPILVVVAEAASEIGERTSDQKIFLHES